MRYNKRPLSIEQQIEKLKSRGLIFDDEKAAADYLSNISYYRLRAYTYPFQDNINRENDHRFIRNDIHFSDIIDLYRFDGRLRLLIFNAVEKIEISIRTKIVYEYSIKTRNSHWFLDKNLYYKSGSYDSIIEKIKYDINRSKEDFVKHYRDKYKDPNFPPAWMTLETLSFGNLSQLLSILDGKSVEITNIIRYFGLPDFSFFFNWIHAISSLRNYCAHHSRIWNRRFPVEIKLPYNTANPFIDKKTLKKYTEINYLRLCHV